MPARRILIIDGHPDDGSYGRALAEAYRRGAERSGAEVRMLNLRDLSFDPILRHGYRQRMELEPDLVAAQELLTWSEHQVWLYPVWWGSLPALLKGFIDRTFLPGFAFKKRPGSLLWDRYLQGRSARVICTMDQPTWYYSLVYRSPSHHAMARTILRFVGIRPVRITAIGPVRLSTEAFRNKWLQRVERLGEQAR